MRESRDTTRLFLGVMLVLSALGGFWCVATYREAGRYRAAAAAARESMPALAVFSAELSRNRAGEQLDDQAAIRHFMMFRAGLSDVDVRVEERPDGDHTVRTFTVRLPHHSRRQAFGYVYNVRRQVAAVRLTEVQQHELPGQSVRPHDRWRWTLVFSSRELGS